MTVQTLTTDVEKGIIVVLECHGFFSSPDVNWEGSLRTRAEGSDILTTDVEKESLWFWSAMLVCYLMCRMFS